MKSNIHSNKQQDIAAFPVVVAKAGDAQRGPAPGKSTVLDPSRLDPLTERAVMELGRQGESENTQRSYRTAARYWAAWYLLRFQQSITLPVPTAAVVQFIVDHVQRQDESNGELVNEMPKAVDDALVDGGFKAQQGPLSLSTISHRLSVLSKIHRMEQLENPCEQPKVRQLMLRARTGYAKRGVKSEKKSALARSEMELLLGTCDDSLRGVRDRALLLFAWASGGRRRSEVSEATMDRLTKVGPARYVYRMGHSKTQQSGGRSEDGDKPVVGIAGEALELWLAQSGIQEGQLFRRIRGDASVCGRLAPSSVREIVMKRVRSAGLDESVYSAHSLRSGFVTEAARQGVPMGETMVMTGHRSVATVVGYFRTAESMQSKAARLLDNGPEGVAAENPGNAAAKDG